MYPHKQLMTPLQVTLEQLLYQKLYTKDLWKQHNKTPNRQATSENQQTDKAEFLSLPKKIIKATTGALPATSTSTEAHV